MSGKLVQWTKEEYDGDTRYLRRSDFQQFIQDPAVFCAYNVSRTAEKPAPTDRMILGDAFHEFILEGRQTWDVAGQCESRLGSGKRKGERCGNSGTVLSSEGWLCGVHGRGQESQAKGLILTLEQEKAFHRMAGSIQKHPEAKELLGPRDGIEEATIIWEDHDSKQAMKARFDRLKTDGRIVDLKWTGLATPREFAKYAYGDHGMLYLQEAWYRYAARSIGVGDVDSEFFFVVCHSVPPCYPVRVWQLPSEAVDVGRRLVKEGLRNLRHCYDFKDFSSVLDTGSHELEPPEWFKVEHKVQWE